MEVFVILRETGEYSDRDVVAIRYVHTEGEAQAAVDRATVEAQSMFHLKPEYPTIENTHGFQMPDGSWLPADHDFWGRPHSAKYCLKPDADEITRRNEERHAEYGRQCLAMGCVDPMGPQAGASYHYQAVSLWNGGDRP